MRVFEVAGGSTYQVHELEALEELAVLVLEPMGLVDDHAAPLDGVELGTAAEDHLERGDDGLKPVGTSYRTTLGTRGGRGEMFHHITRLQKRSPC